MNVIVQILAADGTHSPYEESQVGEMLKQGLISPDTLYWKEGMAAWRPVRELFPPAQPSLVPPRRGDQPIQTFPSPRSPTSGLPSSPVAVAQPQTFSDHYHFRTDPEPLTTILQIMLVLSIIAEAIDLYYAIGLNHNVFDSNVPKETGLSYLHSMTVFSRISIWVGWIAAIPFLMWIYRANNNCRGFASNMKFTPGWTVGWCLIPFANWVYPYLIMQEIWKVSSNPAHWQMEKSSVFIKLWWAYSLGVKVIAIVVFANMVPLYLKGHPADFLQKSMDPRSLLRANASKFT